MKLTTIPGSEWAQVENAAVKFWDKIAGEIGHQGESRRYFQEV